MIPRVGVLLVVKAIPVPQECIGIRLKSLVEIQEREAGAAHEEQ